MTSSVSAFVCTPLQAHPIYSLTFLYTCRTHFCN